MLVSELKDCVSSCCEAAVVRTVYEMLRPALDSRLKRYETVIEYACSCCSQPLYEGDWRNLINEEDD